MGKVVRNDDGSVVLERNSGGRNFKWFSGASFRRRIIDTVSCGGGGFRHHHRQNKIGSNSYADVPKSENPTEKKECSIKSRSNGGGGSEKLSELLRLSEPEDEEVKKKEEALVEFKRAVKLLQSDGDGGEVMVGAIEVRRLAKEDSEARTTMALLGAIPPLVALLDSDELDSQIAALYALLNLGIGNDANKAAIVKAGAVHKMLKLIECPSGSPNQDLAGAIVANFLGLSALDSNKPIIGSSDAIPFLVNTLKDVEKGSNSNQAKHDSLRALYNLSILPVNIVPMLETDLVRILLSMLGEMDVSEKILSVMSNVVSTPEGRKAISSVRDSFPILVDILNWTDSPDCQEKATYILMVMAHKAYGDRQAMIEAGVVSSLLELTLLGSTLAQKRASRILEFLRVDKGKQVSETFAFGGGLSSTVSAPLCSSTSMAVVDPNSLLSMDFAEEDNMMSDEKKAVKHLVQQSLQSNMRRIVKRANLPQDFVPSDHFKSLTASSTSKSLPF